MKTSSQLFNIWLSNTTSCSLITKKLIQKSCLTLWLSNNMPRTIRQNTIRPFSGVHVYTSQKLLSGHSLGIHCVLLHLQRHIISINRDKQSNYWQIILSEHSHWAPVAVEEKLQEYLELTTLPVLLRAALSILQSVDFPAPLGPTITTPMRCLSCSFSSSAFFSYTQMEKKKVYSSRLVLSINLTSNRPFASSALMKDATLEYYLE